tara:strand:+ start:8739 stop:9272 length:534 start_codon:yes stop_codon:yes gene_type:complete
MSINTINNFAKDVAKKNKDLIISSTEDKYTKLAKIIKLADVKTLEQLMNKLKQAGSNLTKAYQATEKELVATDKLGKEYDAMEVKVEKIKEEQMKVGNKFGDAQDKWENVRGKLVNEIDTNLAAADNLIREANAIKTAAKQLGIDKIPVVSQAMKVIENWKKIDVKANKVYYTIVKG